MAGSARRALHGFWAVLAIVVVAGGATLQWLGPPPARGAATPSQPIAAPLAALQEPAEDFPGAFLPRVGADGQRPDVPDAAARAGDRRQGVHGCHGIRRRYVRRMADSIRALVVTRHGGTTGEA